ncbi:hypothetical protein HOD08_03625 [bacterium]|jgi:hypothetical protein|nr:hypothetical protein [bacterium]
MNFKIKRTVIITIASAALLSHCNHCLGNIFDDKNIEEKIALTLENLVEKCNHDIREDLVAAIDKLIGLEKNLMFQALTSEIMKKTVSILEPELKERPNSEIQPNPYFKHWYMTKGHYEKICHILNLFNKNAQLTDTEEKIFFEVPELFELSKCESFRKYIKNLAKPNSIAVEPEKGHNEDCGMM